jgi:2,4-dienoyl-CoA reductase-like NADH-dependent reductase (Old Yellow Enzyme family)
MGLAEVVKDQGALAAIQHCGRQKLLGTLPIKAAFAVPWVALKARSGDKTIPQKLTIPEIEQVAEAFSDAARQAVAAGI